MGFANILLFTKKKGEATRLCTDYRRVNQLKRLIIYLMHLNGELLQDMDKAMWYCPIIMASGFWVVEMTDEARSVSAIY